MKSKQQELIDQKIQSLADDLKKSSGKDSVGINASLWTGFQADEHLLIQLMHTAPPTNGPYPKITTPGNIEYGWVLYYLNVDLPASGSAGLWLQQQLTTIFKMPKSKITASDWTSWQAIWNAEGILLGDGSLVSSQLFAVMDTGWSLAVLDYLRLQIGLSSLAPFATNAKAINIDPSTQTSLSIAIMGDWGTGNYTDGPSQTSPSNQIMAQIAALKPDMVIHLGDVYYAGSDNVLIFSGEEQTNLVDAWAYNAPLGNFTLNSNHEMYSGANGYYNVALKSPLFANQTNTSYFSITYGDWVILGLDSAYNSSGMNMQGRITDPYQPAFIQAQAANKNTIVLTHHNPVDLLGQNTNPLWDDLMASSALNGAAPAIWYWGHIHNGIVYSENAVTSESTRARCLGNAAIPIGTANWLLQEQQQSQSTIDFFTNTALNDGNANNALRVKNGFAILTIQNGTVTETWYDQSGAISWTSASGTTS
jgi:Calcineurin-like phosphoesterase